MNWLFYIIASTCFSNVLNKNLELEMFHRLLARNVSNFLLARAATTATTVGGWTIVGGLLVDAVNTSVEVATGTNFIAKGAYKLLGNVTRLKRTS